MYAKMLSLQAAFFVVPLLMKKQKKPFASTKEPFCFSNVFCTHYFSKTKRNTAKKNTDKCFPIYLYLTCQKLGFLVANVIKNLVLETRISQLVTRICHLATENFCL